MSGRMRALLGWLDDRTGWRSLATAAVYGNLPGGARWRYVWGSTVLFGLGVEFVTGLFLWMAYSPSAQTAWESVYYIQNDMMGGWLLRGLHHYMADALVILLGLHFMQTIIWGAYQAPREVNYWVGLALLLAVLATALTGYLLPWDQHGYWGTQVRLGYIALTPLVGPFLERLAIGGAEMGHHTLTRFFALHAGALPVALVLLALAHGWLLRHHSRTAQLGGPANQELPPGGQIPPVPYWPEQVLRDLVACLGVLAAVSATVCWGRLAGKGGELGAPLGAPADPLDHYDAARPEWFFRFLHELLKFFPGSAQVIGAVFVPSLVLLLIFLLPFIGRWRLGHRFNLGLVCCLLAGAALLTWLGLAQDRRDPAYQAAAKAAERETERVLALAKGPAGIPTGGAVTLLRNDPLTQGPKLFAQKCASCHRYGGHDGTGQIPREPQSASDLKGFASREWLAGLLDPAKITTTNYFGATKFREGKMVRFVKKNLASFAAGQKDRFLHVPAAVSAEAHLDAQQATEERDGAIIEDGRALILDEIRCTECHQFDKEDQDATAPDLTGYGSRQWLTNFISDPAQANFYGERNDRMPAFGRDQILSQETIGLLADWLRGTWYDPAINPKSE